MHEAWTVEGGLPVNSITGVIQNRDGYIWATTFDGLVRFDGVRSTVFNMANSEELPSNRFITIQATRDGTLWLRTEQNHLVRFRNSRFTHFGPQRGLSEAALSVHEDDDGTIWVGTSRGLGVIRDERFVPVARRSLQLPVLTLLRRRDGTLWAGSNGVWRLARQDTSTAVRIGPATDSVRALYEDADRTLWVGSDTGIWKEAEGWQRIRTDGIARPVVLSFTTGAGALFAFAQHGVYRIAGLETVPVDARERTLFNPLIWSDSAAAVWHATGWEIFRNGQRVYALPADSTSALPATTITGFVFDHEGSLWLGTQSAGLHRLKPALFTNYSAAEGLSNRNANTVYQDRAGDVWVGTRGGGLNRIERDGRVTSFTPAQGYPLDVRSLLESGADGLLIGSAVGVARCTRPAMVCRNAGLQGEVFAMTEDRSGRVWVGMAEGLFHSDGGSWARAPDSAGAPAAPVRAFLQSRDGALWMGTNGGGLVRYHGGVFTRLSMREGLPTDLVRSLYQDVDGWLWVGTEGRGLARLDPRAWGAGTENTDRRIVSFRERDGLFDEVIHQILEDDAGRLWMSTNRGIFWVTHADLDAFAEGRSRTIRSTAYTERDGLRNREANGGMQPAGIRTRDGRMWFATQEGVAVVDPSRLESNRAPPPVVIERVIAKGLALPSDTGGVQLGLDQRDVEIEYTALSFLAPANVRFRYRLAPYDADWIDAGSRRTAFYTRLPPGRYTFQVLASNNEGVWNEQGASLAVVVTPRFRETRSFQLALVLMLGLAAFGAARLRELRLRQRAAALEAVVADRTVQLREMDQAKSRLFANLSHEFRTPLTLILGPLRSLLDGRHGSLPTAAQEQHELMLRNGQRLLRLINQVLDLSRLQAREVRLQRGHYDVVDFARTVTLAFAPLGERRGITLRFRTDVPDLTLAFDAEQLEKVLLNLLSNALKFTEEGGLVETSVRRAKDSVEIAVRDTGVGIAPDQLARVFDRFYQADTSATRRYEGTGIGLALAKDLVDLHGGVIRAESTAGAGSTFTVTLPVDAATAMATTRAPAPAVTEVVTVAADEPVASGTTSQDTEEDRTTVLVVDDNADVRTYVQAVLAPSYRIIEASDGVEGLERARAELPDLIVADVMMPGLDGLALGRELKTDPMTDAIPVVLLTARAATEDQVAGLETGADAYLTKPFDPAVLEAQVANLLAQRIRLRERFRLGDAAPPSPAPPSPSPLEMRLRPLVEARLHDPDFSPAALAHTAGLSYQQMYRALRDELRTTPSRFIRTVRVECAAELLHQRAGSITEVGYSVGFESISYFNRAFRERFGCTPSEHTVISTT